MGEGILMYGLLHGRISKACQTIAKVLDDIKTQGFSRISPFSIGLVEQRMQRFAKQHGIPLASKDIFMDSKHIKHATRALKEEKNIKVPERDLIKFPIKRRKMSLFYDKRTSNFTYTDGKNKFIVHPNYSLKMPNGKMKVVNFITASKVDGTEFNQKNYIKV